MGRSRRKGARKGKDKLKLGDLVLAKIKGFPAWPAKISRPEDWDRLTVPQKYFVEFFGTARVAFVAASDIRVFTNESKGKLSVRRQVKTVKHFARAVEEICEAFDEMQQKGSGGPGEGVDSSVVGPAPSSTDGVEGGNNLAYHGTLQVEAEEEKLEQKDADKSESSSDEQKRDCIT